MSTDITTIDGIVKALYNCISFSKGVGPNYKVLRSLFHSQAQITAPKEDTAGKISPMTVEQFINYFDTSLKTEGILEVGAREEEIKRRTLQFKRIANVFSGYQFTPAGSKVALTRGINTIQLMHNDGRWWILSLSWDRAKPDDPLTIEEGEKQ